MVVAILRGVADAGAAFGLFGGLLGAGLAVGGAIWQSDRAHRRDELANTEAVRAALAALRTALEPVARDQIDMVADENAIFDFDAFKIEIEEALANVGDTLVLLRGIVADTKLVKFSDRQALFHLLRILEPVGAILEKEAGVIRRNRPTRPIVKIYYEVAQPGAIRAIRAIDTAMVGLRG